MKFEISGHAKTKEVRLTIYADRELAGEVLDFTYRRFEELDQQLINSIPKTMPGLLFDIT